jgi:hypothetical protein
MDDSKFTISFINGQPGLVVRGNTAAETDANIKEILPIYKRFRDAIEAKRASMGITTPQPTQTPVDTAPVCPYHNHPMKWKTGTYKTDSQWHKAGEPYGFWSCGSKLANGDWCNYKPKK